MRVLISIIVMFWGLTALAQEQILAEGTDNEGPKVELKLPEPTSKAPLIQNFKTEKGELAAVVTPEDGDEYFMLPPQEAYQTQYPQDREADVPINDANWVFIGW